MDIDSSYLTTLSSQAVSNANTSKLKNTLSQIKEGAGTGKTGEKTLSADDEKLLDACKQFEYNEGRSIHRDSIPTVPAHSQDDSPSPV